MNVGARSQPEPVRIRVGSRCLPTLVWSPIWTLGFCKKIRGDEEPEDS